MRILSANNIDRSEWSRLVASSATGTWFQTPEAYEFFASMPVLFKPFVVGVTCDPTGAQTQLRGVCVGYVTVEKNPLKQFLTRRAIILGGCGSNYQLERMLPYTSNVVISTTILVGKMHSLLRDSNISRI